MNTDSWELPEELRQIQDTVARFMAAEVKPAEDKLPHDAYELPADTLDRLQNEGTRHRPVVRAVAGRARRRGPEPAGAGRRRGGSGQVPDGRLRAGLRRLRGRPAERHLPGHAAADPEVRASRASAQGKKIYVAISEASGGADPARSIRARAVRKGDRYILNGSKMWITGADGADWGIVFARTGEQGDRGGITCFIVNGKPEGMSLKPIPVIRSYAPYEITFKDVEIPVEDRLGEEGQGFAVCEKWLIEGRIPYAAGTIGIAQAALQIAIDWARERETFRTKLAEKQAVQWMIADSEMELRAARLLTWQAAWVADLGRGDLKIASSIAKVVATETAGRVVDRCIQILGASRASRRSCRWNAGTANCASSASAKARPKCIAWCWRASCWASAAEGSAAPCRSTSTSWTAASPSSRSTARRSATHSTRSTTRRFPKRGPACATMKQIRVAVVTGAGDKVFSAGADLKSWIGREVPAAETVADAEGHAAQPRAGDLEARGRGDQRPLPGRRHDADAGHRHPRRRRSRHLRAQRSQARHHPCERRHAAAAGAAAACHRHGDAADSATPSTRRPRPAGGSSTAWCRRRRSWRRRSTSRAGIAANAPLAVQAIKELALRSRGEQPGRRLAPGAVRPAPAAGHRRRTRGAQAFAEKRAPQFKGT